MSVNPNQRMAMQTMALDATKTYEREALDRIRRMSLCAADLEVRNAKKMPLTTNQPEGVNDIWFDDNGEPIATAPFDHQA